MFGPFAFITSFKVGNFEKRSIRARKYFSLPCPSINGPPKSSRISSFGSEHGGRGAQWLFRIILFKFLPNSVQGRHVFDLFINSRLIMGHHKRCPSSVIPHAPRCVECRTSMTDFWGHLGLRVCCQGECSRYVYSSSSTWHKFVCLLNFLHLWSSPVRMQSRTSRSTVSLFVMAAMSWVLNISSRVFFGNCSSLSGADCFVVGLRYLLIEKVFLGLGEPVVGVTCSLFDLSDCYGVVRDMPICYDVIIRCVEFGLVWVFTAA